MTYEVVTRIMNSPIDVDTREYSVFDSKLTSPVSILDYINRWERNGNPAHSSKIVALMLFLRILEVAKIRLDEINFHRIFGISNVIAQKINQDDSKDMWYYSQLSGIGYQELLMLERKFLTLIDFNLEMSQEDYESFIITHGLD